MLCPRCGKRLPGSVRYCAYCGAAIDRRPWRAWLATFTLPGAARPTALLGLLGAALGALIGGLTGQLLGDASQGDVLMGGLVGALGLGIASAWGDTFAAAHFDRESARRFGQAYGGLGGALAAVGSLLVSVLIIWQFGQPSGLEALLSLISGYAVAVLRTAIVGGLLGAAIGLLAGRFTARVGYDVLQRRGAVVGAAAAWTLGGIVGGLFAGNSAARLIGGDPVSGALLGMVVQVGLGSLALTQFQRLAHGWRAWRRGQRPHP